MTNKPRTTEATIQEYEEAMKDTGFLDDEEIAKGHAVVADLKALISILKDIGEIEPLEDGYHPFLKQGYENFRHEVQTIIKKNLKGEGG